jgi:hypothetical protein
VIDIAENVSQALKKLFLASHLSPFEFFFHCKEQVGVAGAE